MKKKIKPLVSIIMNCHNGEKYLNISLRSIIYQSFKNWELIFWDNKSNDRSKQILLSYKDKRIRYFRSRKFFNIYKARNLAIKKARGEYVCFLDTDDRWKKNKLSTQVKFFKKNKNSTFVFSNFYIYNEKFNLKKLHIKKNIINGKITQHLLNDYKIGILTVMLKKKLFKNKQFNTRYNIIGDFDYFINLSLKENFSYLNKPLAYYRYHENNVSKKIGLYVQELNFWLKENSQNLINQGFKLNFIKYFYYKLVVKSFLSFLGVWFSGRTLR